MCNTWHHRLNGHEFEQTPGDTEEQGRLPCCSPWCCKELDMTEQLNNNTWNYQYLDYLGDPKKSMRKPIKKQRKYMN